MVLSDEKIRGYMKRLLMSRMRILVNNGFYGLLLMHMIYSIDEGAETAATDGKRIYFAPEFLDNLSDSELDFVMMHEILHIVLQHCLRGKSCDNEQFNIACDIVVNSNILRSENMNLSFITLQNYGEAMHLAPDGKEGYEYTAEQVYTMLPQVNLSDASGANGNGKGGGKGKGSGEDGENRKGSGKGTGKSKSQQAGNSPGWDDHSRWGTLDDEALDDVWKKRVLDACEAISIRDPSNSRGLLPLCAERILKELKKPQTDWRTILNEFVQQEICDYSFSPPDRRFDDSPFFLPDFNEKDDIVEDILFMIDTSGSMSDDMITAAYSEVKGALGQFNGKLKGWLGFFDAAVVEPQPFSDNDELEIIKPKGGGGTSFGIIFDYVFNKMSDKPPVCIIILTDGYAPFPQESKARGIPVLWLLNNEDVNPPWGKTARITL